MYDYHTHTIFSDDCSTPVRDMIDAACRMGIKEMAITDHYDPDYPDRPFPFEMDLTGYHKMLNEMKEEYKDKIHIVKGIEIGIQHGETIDKCSKEANSFDYDFIIGSFHFAEGYDLHAACDFYEGRTLEEIYIAFYSYMLDCLKKFKDYDVLGHINYIDRYADGIPDFSVYRDLVEEILRLIIGDGKGLEINTSSFRHGMGERTTPAKEILDLYVKLGGGIVTIGSDAHRPKDLGHRLDYAVEMIRSAGIGHLATFHQRKLKLISLDSL
jgi:histidinol-phosphatase (PHP family)